MSDERMVKVSASLPPDMADWLVFVAERKGITASEAMRRAACVAPDARLSVCLSEAA